MGREAIILAGGKGSRLQSLVSDRPKPMALINGKPFLFYLLNFLSKNNFTHLILAVGYKSESIRQYFGSNFLGMKITYAVEEKPLGTGGAIKNALNYAKNEHTFIFNGDTYFPVSVIRLETESTPGTDLVIALVQLNDISRYGSVEAEPSGRINRFIEKKGEMASGLINGGVYLLKKHSFISLEFPENFSFENDYLNKFTNLHTFRGVAFNNYFIDIGIPETFEQAQSDFYTFDI